MQTLVPFGLFPRSQSLRIDPPAQPAALRSPYWRPIAAAVTTVAETGRSSKISRLEAALFVSNAAQPPRKLAQFAALSDAKEVRGLIAELNALYDSSGSAFRVEQLATGYQLLTKPEFALWLDRLHQRQTHLKLSPPALETLSVIAYRQPITRAEIDTVRGVQSVEMVKQLMERGLVRISGEDDSLGRPFLYSTTKAFLETYGLHSLEDLPMAERLRRIPAAPIVEPEETDDAGNLES